MSSPAHREKLLHVPDKSPKYLLTATGYVLADPEVEEASEISNGHKFKSRQVTYYAKGESTARRQLRKKANLEKMISRFPELKLVSQHFFAHSAEENTLSRASREPEIVLNEQRRPKVKKTKLQPINLFMQYPRRYNVITFVEDQCWKTPSHFDKYKNRDYDSPTDEEREALLPKIERFRGNLPHHLDMGKGSLAKIRLYTQHKNATSEINPVAHGEDDKLFWSKSDPKKDIKLLTNAYRMVKCIGLRENPKASKPQVPRNN